MSLLTAELRKVWGNRVFPMLLAVLVWALYTVGLAWRPAGVHPMLMLAAMIAVGLAALLPADAEVAQAVASRLKLSNASRKRLALATEPAGPAREMAYRTGLESAVDRLLLAGKVEAVRELGGWEIPRLPVSGGNLVSAGIVAGPAVAAMLRRIEDRWIAEGFPDQARARAILAEIIRGS